MPWSRIRELLLLWGFDIREEPDGKAETIMANVKLQHHSNGSNSHTSATAAARVLAVLILMSCVTRGVARALVRTTAAQSGLNFDVVGVCDGRDDSANHGLGVAGLRTIEQYGPGAAERRQRRLLRLREQTAATIEAELRQRSSLRQRHRFQEPGGGRRQPFQVTKDNGTACLQGHPPRAAAVLQPLPLSER